MKKASTDEPHARSQLPSRNRNEVARAGKLACTSIQKSTCTAQWIFPRETTMERMTDMWWVKLTWTSRSSSTYHNSKYRESSRSSSGSSNNSNSSSGGRGIERDAK